MKDAVSKWAVSHLLAMSAKYKQTHNKEVDDTVMSQLTQQRDALTSDWSEENCYGQSAVLTLKLMAAFYEQTLLLAYGQQTNDHLRIQIQEEVSLIIEHARETQETPSLDRLFRTFRAKYADLTGKAADAAKESKKDKMQERTKVDNQDFIKGLTSMLATSGHTAAAMQ